MASNNQAIGHASNTEQDANAYNMAIVPYEPSQQTLPTLSGPVLAAVPISYALPADLQAVPTSSRRRRSLAATKSEQISMDLFALNLPQDCIDHLSSKEQVLMEYKEETSAAPQERWFNIYLRLLGWRCETRMRNANHHRVDKYFYHANMKFRSLKELRFYIKYGFMPRKLKDKKIQETVEEAGPSTSRRNCHFLDHKEEELINKFSISRHIIAKVDRCIKMQLHWTKHHRKPALTNG